MNNLNNMNNGMSNQQSVPNKCTPSNNVNQHRNLQTVYSSKCNDHLTPNVSNTSNIVMGSMSDKSWSNVRGYGFIQHASCDNQLTSHHWNRIPSLNINKNDKCS